MNHPISQEGRGDAAQAVLVADTIDEASWCQVLSALREPSALPAAHGTRSLWEPLLRPAGHPLVIAQLGQSLDGRIATPSGHSHYVNGPAAITHLHRLRALVDAVVIGVGTALADDPQLTVRRVEGDNPARVVIDPDSRLPSSAQLLTNDGCRRVLIRADDGRNGETAVACPDVGVAEGVEVLSLPRAEDGSLAPALILHALAQIGLRRILVEGGAHTVSRFLAAGCVHRLHLSVAPMVIGSGPIGLNLPPIRRLDEATRFPRRCWRMGEDLLFDIPWSGVGWVRSRG